MRNPADAPKLFRPCAETFAGVCSSSPTHAEVLRMTVQFQTMLNRHKAEAGVLLKFGAWVPPMPMQEAASSSQAGVSSLRNTVGSSWWILGCTSLRPLAHVLMKCRQVTPGSPVVLVPNIGNVSMKATVSSSIRGENIGVQVCARKSRRPWKLLGCGRQHGLGDSYRIRGSAACSSEGRSCASRRSGVVALWGAGAKTSSLTCERVAASPETWQESE